MYYNVTSVTGLRTMSRRTTKSMEKSTGNKYLSKEPHAAEGNNTGASKAS